MPVLHHLVPQTARSHNPTQIYTAIQSAGIETRFMLTLLFVYTVRLQELLLNQCQEQDFHKQHRSSFGLLQHIYTAILFLCHNFM